MSDLILPLPMIWCRQEEYNDAYIKKQSFNGWRTEYEDLNMPLYTQEQVDVLVRQAEQLAEENEALRKQIQKPFQQPYVWMISTKTFMALFDSRESAEQAMNGNATASTYIPPVAVPVFTTGLPK